MNSKMAEHQRVYNRDTLLKMMQKPLHLADSLNLPLYCGEFGVLKNFFPESKLAWYRDMVSIFDEYKIAYANWNYKSGAFGIVDDNMKPVLSVIKILTNSKRIMIMCQTLEDRRQKSRAFIIDFPTRTSAATSLIDCKW